MSTIYKWLFVELTLERINKLIKEIISNAAVVLLILGIAILSYL